MARHWPITSLELFAPETPEGAAQLRPLWPDLEAPAPPYFSVTCALSEIARDEAVDLLARLGARVTGSVSRKDYVVGEPEFHALVTGRAA